METMGIDQAIKKYNDRKCIPQGAEYDEIADKHEPVMVKVIYEFSPGQIKEVFSIIDENIYSIKEEKLLVGLYIALQEIGCAPIIGLDEKRQRKFKAKRGSIISWFKQKYPQYKELA